MSIQAASWFRRVGRTTGERWGQVRRQRMTRVVLLGALALALAWPGAGHLLMGTAQALTCNVIIGPAVTDVDGTTVKRVDGTTGVRAGDTVCIQPSNPPRDFLNMNNFVGSAAAPLTITNSGGKVIIGTADGEARGSNHKGFKIKGSKYFTLSGKGDPAHTYGIWVRGTYNNGAGYGVSGLSLEGMSEYFTVENIEVSETGFAGIMSKTESNCQGVPSRDSWVQHNTYFRNNYVHDTDGEGFYIGHSKWAGYTPSGCPSGYTVLPHAIEGVQITGNKVERTKWDGIQLSSARKDALIELNTVTNYGQENVSGQRQGIQINSGTTGWVHRNVIKNGRGNGIEMHGLGGNVVANNLIIRADGDGIYRGPWTDSTGNFAFYNNTIVSPGRNGLKVDGSSGGHSTARNNLLYGHSRVTAGACLPTATNLTESNNRCADDAAEQAAVRFVSTDPATENYHLQAGSSALDAGADLRAQGVTLDLDGRTRPQGTAFEIGAYELPAGSTPTPTRTSTPVGPSPTPTTPPAPALFQQDFQSSTSVASYVNATAPASGQFNNISAEATGGGWSINGGRLQLVRTGSSTTDNDAGITRHTDFASSPSLLHITFDLGVSAWTNSPFQTGALVFSVGDIAAFSDYGNGDVANDTFHTFSVNGKGSGSFALATSGIESAPLATNGAAHRVAFFLNKSASSASYRAPDGSLRTLRANGAALWVDTTAVVADTAAANGSSSRLSDIRLRWSNPDNATWTLDNFVIRGSFPQ